MGKTTKSKEEYTISESVDRFFKLKIVKNIINEKAITNHNFSELSIFFNIHPYYKCSEQTCKNLAHFIKHDLSEFHSRFISLRNLVKNSLEWHLMQMGQQGKKIFLGKYVNNINFQNKKPGFRTSNAAIMFFKEIELFLKKSNIPARPIYYDNNDKLTEFRIQDSNDKWFCYDFTLKELNLIIEFNGGHCHPNPALPLDDWKKWKHYFSKESADVVFKKDLYKKELAEMHGFQYITVWFDYRTEDSLKYVKSVISGKECEPYHKRKLFFILTDEHGNEHRGRLNYLRQKYNISEHYTHKMLNIPDYTYNGCTLRKVYEPIL